jgi:hypothetical protein
MLPGGMCCDCDCAGTGAGADAAAWPGGAAPAFCCSSCIAMLIIWYASVCSCGAVPSAGPAAGAPAAPTGGLGGPAGGGTGGLAVVSAGPDPARTMLACVPAQPTATRIGVAVEISSTDDKIDSDVHGYTYVCTCTAVMGCPRMHGLRRGVIDLARCPVPLGALDSY